NRELPPEGIIKGRDGGDAESDKGIPSWRPSESATLGAEGVVRDTLYNSHGLVALDGYLYKVGAYGRLTRRWMMLIDNIMYYFRSPK
ncbi:unnamed protein product, partial [Discosporangium mesarthrocarpum]